ELRRILADELGIDPSPALQDLERAVLTQDPSLMWSAPPDAPSPLPVRGVELPTGSVTFLLTDVEGSTRLWDADPDGMAAALLQHDAAIGESVGAAGGWIIKSKGEGDSTLSVFIRATDAARAAVAIQHAVGDALRVRIALHTG